MKLYLVIQFLCETEKIALEGVLIAVKGNIQASRLVDLEKEGTEVVVMDLKKGKTKPVSVYCFYNPDSSSKPILELNSSLTVL